MALGTRPSRRYHRAWATQRILNHLAPWVQARSCPVSVLQQLINPVGLEIQQTEQKLMEERKNVHLTTCNPLLMDSVSYAELPFGFFFTEVANSDGSTTYTPPTVYATINGTETEIAIAENNDVETLYYDCLPTRIEYGETQELWVDVIPETVVSSLSSLTPESLVIEGNLFITLADNSIWSSRYNDILYFSKITITGTTRKGTEETETIPLRYNGTFKTVNQWKEITEIFVNHISPDAKITVSCLPIAESPVVDTWNVSIPSEGGDRLQFLKLESQSWGSSFVGESYLNTDLELVRMGIDDVRRDFIIELLDENGNNISANDFLLKPFSDLMYVIDDNNLYVYDRNIPYPDLSKIVDQSPDVRMALTTDDNQWIYMRGETATIITRIMDVGNIPVSYRWLLTTPDGTQYRIGEDNSLWSISETGWIGNTDTTTWNEKKIEILLDDVGTYTLEMEARYQGEDEVYTDRKSKLVLLVPVIQPEVQFVLPAELIGCQKISMDTDGIIWFYNGTSILKMNLFHDYFVVDYLKRNLWLNEEYSKIRVVP